MKTPEERAEEWARRKKIIYMREYRVKNRERISRWNKDYQVYRSAQTYPAWRTLALLAEGTHWRRMDNYYAITGGLQYAFSTEGWLYLAIPKERLNGYDSQAVRDWMQSAGTELVLVQ